MLIWQNKKGRIHKSWVKFGKPTNPLFPAWFHDHWRYRWHVLGEGAKVLQPIADTFLNLLYCCVVPLIFCSLTSAIAKMDDLSKLRKIMGTFLIGTFVTGIIACIFMIIPALIINPGEGVILEMPKEAIEATGSLNILGMFTVGDFIKLFSKSSLMALIVFTVIFSIAVIQAGEKGKPIVRAMDSLTSVIVNVINIVMKLAPLGLGCYFAILIGGIWEKKSLGLFPKGLSCISLLSSSTLSFLRLSWPISVLELMACGLGGRAQLLRP